MSAMGLQMLRELVCDVLEALADAPDALRGTDERTSNLRRTLRNIGNDPDIARLLVERARIASRSVVREDADRTAMVREFFDRVVPHEERREVPSLPSERAVRLRLRLLAEEFVELLDEAFDDRAAIDQLRSVLKWFDDLSPLRSDLARRLPEFVKEAFDVAYSVEALFVTAGVDGSAVFRLGHESNLRKAGGPRRESDGKALRPSNWTPPDIVGELRRQGWKGCVSVGQTRRGATSPGMNPAFVKFYDPLIEPPWFVEWPKDNEIGAGGWYDEASVAAFWPEIVSEGEG